MMAILSGFLEALIPQALFDLVGDLDHRYWVRPQVGQLMISGPATA